MPRGGWRGGGRPKGSKSKTTIEREKRLAAAVSDGSMLPLDCMLLKMREAKESGDDEALRFWTLAAAPYCHPRLAAVEQKTEVVIEDKTKKPDAFRVLEQRLELIMEEQRAKTIEGTVDEEIIEPEG